MGIGGPSLDELGRPMTIVEAGAGEVVRILWHDHTDVNENRPLAIHDVWLSQTDRMPVVATVYQR